MLSVLQFSSQAIFPKSSLNTTSEKTFVATVSKLIQSKYGFNVFSMMTSLLNFIDCWTLSAQ